MPAYEIDCFNFFIDCGTLAHEQFLNNHITSLQIKRQQQWRKTRVSNTKWIWDQSKPMKQKINTHTQQIEIQWKKSEFYTAAARSALWLSGAPAKHCLYAIFKDNEKSRTICINFLLLSPSHIIHILRTNTLISRFERFYNSWSWRFRFSIFICSILYYLHFALFLFFLSRVCAIFLLLFTFICISNATWILSFECRDALLLFLSFQFYVSIHFNFSVNKLDHRSMKAIFKVLIWWLAFSGFIRVLFSYFSIYW